MKAEINAPLSREYPRFHARRLADVQTCAPRCSRVYRIIYHDSVEDVFPASRTRCLRLTIPDRAREAAWSGAMTTDAPLTELTLVEAAMRCV